MKAVKCWRRQFAQVLLSLSIKRGKLDWLGSGCDSVGRAVDSNSWGPQFESRHQQKFILNIYFQLYWKDENKEKEAANGPFFKKKIGHWLPPKQSSRYESRNLCPHLKGAAFTPFRWKSLGRECQPYRGLIWATFLWNGSNDKCQYKTIQPFSAARCSWRVMSTAVWPEKIAKCL